MQIQRKKTTVPFSELKPGEVFRFPKASNSFYMKASPGMVHASTTHAPVFAIYLADCTPSHFIEQDEEVYRVKGTFVLGK
jgi:hypothetical protein